MPSGPGVRSPKRSEQLRKKRKAKAKVKTQAFLTFVPAGVAGVPNTDPIPVTLVKQRTKKK